MQNKFGSFSRLHKTLFIPTLLKSTNSKSRRRQILSCELLLKIKKQVTYTQHTSAESQHSHSVTLVPMFLWKRHKMHQDNICCQLEQYPGPITLCCWGLWVLGQLNPGKRSPRKLCSNRLWFLFSEESLWKKFVILYRVACDGWCVYDSWDALQAFLTFLCLPSFLMAGSSLGMK